MIVVEVPGVKGLGLLTVAGEDLAVGPFDLQCAVETLDFAVLPVAVRFDAQMLTPNWSTTSAKAALRI